MSNPYANNAYKTFRCSACEKVITIDVREDERGLFQEIECECGNLMKRFSDPNREPIDIDSLDNNNPEIKI
jgi:hypothetical protein